MWLWVGGRLLLAVALAVAELEPLRLSALGSLQVVLVVAALAWVDMHVRKERALFGNLGVSRISVAATCSAPAAAAEMIIVLAGGAGGAGGAG